MTQHHLEEILKEIDKSSSGDWLVQEGMRHYNEKFMDKTTVLRAIGTGTRYEPKGNIIAYVDSINPSDKMLLSDFKAKLKMSCEYGITLTQIVQTKTEQVADLERKLASSKKQTELLQDKLKKKTKALRESDHKANTFKRRLRDAEIRITDGRETGSFS